MKSMIVKDEIKMNLTYQSIGLQPVKEHLNIEEQNLECIRRGIKIDS